MAPAAPPSFCAVESAGCSAEMAAHAQPAADRLCIASLSTGIPFMAPLPVTLTQTPTVQH
eukprot:359014-Chlamydomonas_euryale.AAC.5